MPESLNGCGQLKLPLKLACGLVEVNLEAPGIKDDAT
jgi:hypothetical protein